MPRIMRDPRYFSIAAGVVGAVAFKSDARNCRPCARSLAQLPLACTNSPAEINGAWPTIVTGSRRPRASTFRTQKPVSGL